MSAPGHPFLQAITDIVTKNLVKLGEGQPEIKAVTQADVLKTTGPMVRAETTIILTIPECLT